MTDSQTDNGYLPISSQKAQTGGADLVAEYIQLQSCNILCLFTPLRNFAGLFLIDDPPFLSVIVIPCLLQGQGDVQFLSIYKNENKLCHSLRLRLIKMQMSKFCSFWKKKKSQKMYRRRNIMNPLWNLSDYSLVVVCLCQLLKFQLTSMSPQSLKGNNSHS